MSIATVLHVCDQVVRKWVHKWNTDGIQGLMKLRKDGSPANLTPDLIQIAVDMAKQKPMFLAEKLPLISGNNAQMRLSSA